MTTPIKQLAEAGTIPWIDNIRRDWLESGEFRRLIESGVMGCTSNPTIFQKAIEGSEVYDAAIAECAGNDLSAEEVFFAIAIEDIQEAADQLRDVHTRTGGRDGRVSFELPPAMAFDTERSTAAAGEFFRRIDRPNVFIKIPGTAAGPQAIEDSIAAGINVNVTLLFALESYEAIANAYIRGIERRVADGEPVDQVWSVASFFVSRVDTAVDKLLDDDSPLRGRAAVANAKMAYQRFLDLFSSERWRKLAARGGNVQRPLWASTGTKNPDYSDVLYVETLIGPDCVNTMPEGTIAAFDDHGRVQRTVDAELDEARRLLAAVEAAGVPMDDVTAKLQDDGVQAFADSFDSVVAAIERSLESRHARGAA